MQGPGASSPGARVRVRASRLQEGRMWSPVESAPQHRGSSKGGSCVHSSLAGLEKTTFLSLLLASSGEILCSPFNLT